MNEKTIAAIALNNRDYPSFEAKLAGAAEWVSRAAEQGAELVVLPEALNVYRGDGAGHARALTAEEIALDDWVSATQLLFDVARRCSVAVTIPVITREEGRLLNSFFLVSKNGEVLGRYQKMRPAPPERKEGILPGSTVQLIDWEGLKIGGGICFDCYYPEVFQAQVDAGADLFLISSLTPGGDYLNFYALHHSTPVVLAYPGWSRIIDVDGRDLAGGGYRNETLRFGFGSPVVMATINFDRVVLFADLNQSKMNDIQQAYGNRVRITFDQHNVSFILESRSLDLTVHEIVKRFALVPKRCYFKEAATSEAYTKSFSILEGMV